MLELELMSSWSQGRVNRCLESNTAQYPVNQQIVVGESVVF